MKWTWILVLVVLAGFVGCDDDASGEDDGGSPVDAGTSPMDAGTPEEDAGTSEDDAGNPEEDAGTDSGAVDEDAGGDLDAGTEPLHCREQTLIIAAVDPGTSVTLFNPTGVSFPVSNLWLCTGGGQDYPPLGDLTADSEVAPGGTVVLSWPAREGRTPWPLMETGGDVALYNARRFSDPTAVVDFVCWGDNAGSTRKGTAEAASEWSGDCAPAITGGALTRIPDTDGNAAASWDLAGATPLTCP